MNGKLYQVLQCVGHGGSSKASLVQILSTALLLVSIAALICVFSSINASPGVHGYRPLWTESSDPCAEGGLSRRPKQTDYRGL